MTTPTIEAVSEAPAATAAPAVQTYELEALGRDIAARIKKGDKAKANADDLYLSAGLHLIEAKRLTNNFSAFLRDHCGGLSRSRADELIKIAEGAAEEVREKNRVRDRRRRAKAASVREPRTPVTSKSPLVEFKAAVDTWFPKMDDEARREAVDYVSDWRERRDDQA